MCADPGSYRWCQALSRTRSSFATNNNKTNINPTITTTTTTNNNSSKLKNYSIISRNCSRKQTNKHKNNHNSNNNNNSINHNTTIPHQDLEQQHNDYQIRYRPTSTTTPTILPTAALEKPSTSNCLLTTTILETLKFCDPTTITTATSTTTTTKSHLQYNLRPSKEATTTASLDFRETSTTLSLRKILHKSEYICCWLKSSFQFTILLFIILLLTKTTYANNNIPGKLMKNLHFFIKDFKRHFNSQKRN